MSLFQWLDHSEAERRKMLEMVDLFREKGTRDELGVAAIRDAFADTLFPGTSTVMTRARYYLMVPWTYLQLEKRRVPSSRIAAAAREAEVALIEAIEQSDDSEGNIGTYSKRSLKRLPSSVYWQGLWVWGLRRFNGSQDQYHRSLDGFHAMSVRQQGRKRGRDEEHDDLIEANWHPALSKPAEAGPPAGFPMSATLSLQKGEAVFLRDLILLGSETKRSLLAELLVRTTKHEPVEGVWQHPDFALWRPDLREWVDHARLFSKLTHGAFLLYNTMLAEASERIGRHAAKRDFRSELDAWATETEAEMARFRHWDRRRFWELALGANPRISNQSKGFVDLWWDLLLSSNPRKLPTNESARNLIRDREVRLKKDLARLKHRRPLEIWNGDSGSGALDFRWKTSQRILEDILDGLEVTDA